MGRDNRPWYRASHRCWYAWIGGRQVRLDPDKREAFRIWHSLLSDPAPPSPAPPVTIASLCGQYLDHQRGRISRKDSFNNYAIPILRLVERFGTEDPVTLDPDRVEQWAREQASWGQTRRGCCLSKIASCFRWAVKTRRISSTRLTDLKGPRGRSRGVDAVLTYAQHQALKDNITPIWRDALEMLWLTGCRPGELAEMTVESLNTRARCFILEKHKTAGETGEPRRIYLSDAALDLARRLAAERRQGYLFPTRRGTQTSTGTLLNPFKRARRAAGLPASITMYSYRHTYATNALASGVSDSHVAELLGHRSTDMLHRHYKHLLARADALRTAVNRIRSDAAPPSE